MVRSKAGPAQRGHAGSRPSGRQTVLRKLIMFAITSGLASRLYRRYVAGRTLRRAGPRR